MMKEKIETTAGKTAQETVNATEQVASIINGEEKQKKVWDLHFILNEAMNAKKQIDAVKKQILAEHAEYRDGEQIAYGADVEKMATAAAEYLNGLAENCGLWSGDSDDDCDDELKDLFYKETDWELWDGAPFSECLFFDAWDEYGHYDYATAQVETTAEMLARLYHECQGFEIYTLGDRNWFDNCADNYTFYADSFTDIPFDEDGYVEVDCKYEVVGKEEYSHYTHDGWGWEENDKVLIVVLNEEDIDEKQIMRECVKEFVDKLEEEETNASTYGFLRYDFGQDEYLTDKDKNQITTILEGLGYVEVKIEDGIVVAC